MTNDKLAMTNMSMPNDSVLPPPRDFLSAQAESRSFARLRRRVLLTLLRQTFAHARFRLTLIVVLTSLLWGGMFWMFADGFSFLQATISNADTHARTVGSLFGP